MNEAPKNITPLLRKAIWEAHGRKCAYENILLNWDEVQLDHILPQSIWRDLTEKRRIFRELGIETEFSPHDLGNLLPCRALRNGQKSDWVFDQNSVRFFRQLAEEKRAEVQRWLKKLEEQDEQDRIRSSAEAACDANPALKEKLLAALAVTAPNKTEDSVTPDRVRFSRPRVLLDCKLPRGDDHGSLLININTLYLHKVQLTLEPRLILESLLHGWGTPVELKQRGFIVGPRVDQPDEWIVRLAGATVVLTKAELSQLCEAVDLLAPLFLRSLLNRELSEGTLPFPPDGPRNVRLLVMKRALWGEIQKFAREHDYAKGDSAWHIFDAHGNSHIKTVLRAPDGDIVPFCAYIYCTVDERDGIGPMVEPEHDVCLCWEASMSRLCQDPRGKAAIGWTAEATFAWLTQKLIPEVIRRMPEKPGLLDRFRETFLLREPPKYFSETYGVDRSIFGPISRWSEAAAFIQTAQEHYNSHPHDPVLAGSVRQVLAAFALLIANLEISSEHLGYYSQKLGVSGAGNLHSLIATAQRQAAVQASFDGFDLDNALRCLCGALRDHAPADGKHPALLKSLVTALDSFPLTFQQDVIRYRTLARLEHRSTWL